MSNKIECVNCGKELTDDDYESGEMIIINAPVYNNKTGKNTMERTYLCYGCEQDAAQQEHERMFPSLY